MAEHNPRRHLARAAFRGGAPGFTLMELLAALAVLSVATAILLRMFNASLDLAATSSHRIVASQLGEAKLLEITANPEGFVREPAESPAALYRIYEKPAEDEPAGPIPAGALFAPPTVTPYSSRAQALHEKVYSELRWRAYGRNPRNPSGALVAEPNYIEVVVEVLWEEDGRDQALAFTSILEHDRIPPERVIVEAPEVEVEEEPEGAGADAADAEVEDEPEGAGADAADAEEAA